MDIYAATQAFNAAATKAWTTCEFSPRERG